MLGRPEKSSRPWRIWGAGLGGAVLVAQALAAGHSPSREAVPAVVDTLPDMGEIWRSGVPVGIRVDGGRAIFRAPSSAPDGKLLVIVSSLSRGAGPFPFTLRTKPANLPERPALADDGADSTPPKPPVADLPAIPMPVGGTPPLDRAFHLMVREGDVASGNNYSELQGRLRAVGKRVQVYVASEDVGRVGAEVLRDLVDTFDNRVFPTSATTFGQANDIDGDGRFTIFLSSWLARMGRGKHAVDGFVRVADLDPAYSPPFGNRCDMMYLSTDLEAGPHLRTVVAHEYTHAVLFSRKSLGLGRTTGMGRVEEEGWLDEALAHLAEDLHGFSRSNLDYRVNAFLSKPELYRLVVDDYYAANLFRSHGNRGSTYLFLRWCADRYGPDLLPRLIGSDRSGLANLEAATGSSFARLYRRWTIALASSALGPGVIVPDRGADRTRPLRPRGPFEDRCLAGPRIDRIRAGAAPETWTATGTSSRFLIVEGADGKAVDVEIRGPEGADLQVTAVPLPADLATLDLKVRPSHGVDGDLDLTIAIEEHGESPVRLLTLAWEPLVPPANPKSPMLPRGHLDPSAIASRFGTSTIADGKTLRSPSLRLQGVHRESGPYVLKLAGTDAKGRTVTAWADINIPPSPSSHPAGPDLAGEAIPESLDPDRQ